VLIELLVAEPYRTDDITPAAIYHHLDRRPRTTLLVDAGDNLGPCCARSSIPGTGEVEDRFVGGCARKFLRWRRLVCSPCRRCTGRSLSTCSDSACSDSAGTRLKRLNESDFAIARGGNSAMGGQDVSSRRTPKCRLRSRPRG
jgi:hypothetical protein